MRTSKTSTIVKEFLAYDVNLTSRELLYKIDSNSGEFSKTYFLLKIFDLFTASFFSSFLSILSSPRC
jgi:hypothetical protein